MTIAWEDVFPILAEAIPGFPPSETDSEDRLCYPFISAMVRHVKEQALLDSSDVRRLADLLERLLCEGDGNVHDLAVDAIESVWEGDRGKGVVEHFGPETRKVWNEICHRGWVQ